MKRISLLLIAGATAFPLLVAAQTATTPGGEASTGTPLEQKSGQRDVAPKTTRTSPDATNPSGGLPTKGRTHASRRAQNAGTSNRTGDVPTYPAPAPDGAPTK